MSETGSLLAIAALLALASFTAMAETSIGRIGRVRAHRLAQEGRSSGELLVKVIEDPAPFLNIVLLITLLAHLGGTALATGLAIERFGRPGEVIAAGAMTFVIFVLAEMAPKTFAVQHTERAALLVARPVYYAGRLLQPLARVMIAIANAVMLVLPGRGMPKGPFVTEEELRHLVEIAEQEEAIEEEDRELIDSVFEFGDTVVREVMVPRTDMVAMEARTTLDQALETIVEAGYSRIPVYEGDTDNIVGVLYAKDLLKRSVEARRDTEVRSLARPPLFVPETKKVADLLREMQKQRIHMAIVVDEYGGTAGLVTIEDVVEEIVGEIVDEYDQEEPLVEPLDAGTLRVDAKMPIDEINELLGVELPHEEWDTVGGLVFGLTGRVPAVGETVHFDSIEFRTERVTGRRIHKVIVSKTATEAEPSE
ncbi:MAG TPA: hemolysin family protein [Actinomycetota bacterium]|nr:hemolysin family protein [Actinomycetota bacterium]